MRRYFCKTAIVAMEDIPITYAFSKARPTKNIGIIVKDNKILSVELKLNQTPEDAIKERLKNKFDIDQVYLKNLPQSMYLGNGKQYFTFLVVLKQSEIHKFDDNYQFVKIRDFKSFNELDNEIAKSAINIISNDIVKTDLAKEFLEESFTLSDIYELIQYFNPDIDERSNFARKILNRNIIIPKSINDTDNRYSQRSAQLYTFNNNFMTNKDNIYKYLSIY